MLYDRDIYPVLHGTKELRMGGCIHERHIYCLGMWDWTRAIEYVPVSA